MYGNGPLGGLCFYSAVRLRPVARVVARIYSLVWILLKASPLNEWVLWAGSFFRHCGKCERGSNLEFWFVAFQGTGLPRAHKRALAMTLKCGVLISLSSYLGLTRVSNRLGKVDPAHF